jgi:hypothetical protein
MTPINETLQSARSLADWGFVMVIVLVGAAVVCTIAERLSGQQSLKSLWKALQIIAGVLLIGALAMEYWGHKKETRILDSDNAAQQKQAEMLKTTNAFLISSNLAMAVRLELLRKTNNELEEARLPMNVGGRDAFIESLKDGPPTPVFITTGIGDKKGNQTLEQLRVDLNTAGWRVYNAYETNEYGPGIILKANPGQSEKALHVLLKAFLDRNIPARIMLSDNRTMFPINAIYIFIGERPHPGIAAELVLGGRKREALWAMDTYISGHTNMIPNEVSEANKLGEEVLKLYVERLKEVAKDPMRGGWTNGISQIYLSLGTSGAVTLSNGIPVGYVSKSGAVPFTQITISNWNKLVGETGGTNSN